MVKLGTNTGGIGVFALISGLLLGALVTVVALPRRAPETVVRGGGAVETFDGSAGSSAGPSGATDVDGATSEQVMGAPGGGAGGTDAAAGGSGGAAVAPGSQGAQPGGASGATGGGAAAAPAGPVRGVTADSVKIGIAYPDLAALRALGPGYDNGDVPKQWRAIAERWKREGTVPIAGRDIELVFRSYQVLEPSAQRAACAGFIQDDEVFAVVGVAFFQVGSECVAREFQTPMLTSDGPTETVFSRSGGNLFSLYLSQDSIVRNWARFAADEGLVRGKKVGIYHHTGGHDPEMAALLKGRLESLGAGEVLTASTDQTISGPSDTTAAQRFKTSGVATVFLLTAKQGFMRQAEAQLYNPDYVESDYLFGTGDSVHSSSPPEQMDGTLGVTVTYNGWAAAGMPQPPKQQACIDNYRQVTGEEPNEAGSAEYNYILLSCDFAQMLEAALGAAGTDLNPASFLRAIEAVRTTDTAQVGGLAFSPQRHWGADRLRKVQWKAGCRCWHAIGDFFPLPVP